MVFTLVKLNEGFKIEKPNILRPSLKMTKPLGHNVKWDHFDILAKGKTDYHCKIRETLLIQELEPAFNVNVGSEN